MEFSAGGVPSWSFILGWIVSVVLPEGKFGGKVQLLGRKLFGSLGFLMRLI